MRYSPPRFYRVTSEQCTHLAQNSFFIRATPVAWTRLQITSKHPLLNIRLYIIAEANLDNTMLAISDRLLVSGTSLAACQSAVCASYERAGRLSRLC